MFLMKNLVYLKHSFVKTKKLIVTIFYSTNSTTNMTTPNINIFWASNLYNNLNIFLLPRI